MTTARADNLGPARIFVVRKSEVSNRWDPFYFKPELVALESQVSRLKTHTLRDFVLSKASGATPSTKDLETHYTKSDDGIPFIRVQNLSVNGKLELSGVKRITADTHNGLLRRSRLSGGELLVKITGVGRMAVSSVVPDSFEANINQHIVAIRTSDRKTSEILAAYLNLDIAERLATRRSTGGTRPALDYPALLSMPVVFDERILQHMQEAVKRFESQVKNAETLLATIDDVLLEELGIPRVVGPGNTLQSRTFQRSFSEISGRRLDPGANQEKRRLKEQAIHLGRFPVVPLRKLVGVTKTRVEARPEGERYVGLENISGDTGEFVETTGRESIGTTTRFCMGQILFPKLRPYLNKTHRARFNGVCSTEFHVFTPDGVSGEYLAAFLRSRAIVGITSLLMTGNTLPRLQMSDIERLPIPVPPEEIQERLCSEINVIQSKARSLREQARVDLERAKRDIETLILGGGAHE